MNGMFTGRVMTWIRFVRTSAAILILPTTIESSESAVNALRSPSTDNCWACGTGTLFAGRTGRTPGCTVVVVVVAPPLSKTSFSISTTLLASARWSLMNSLTTCAGGTSICSTMWVRLRITLEFSVIRMLDDFGSARKRGVRLRRRKILPEHLLELDRIGIAQFEKETDDVFALGNVGFVGNDRHAGVARAPAGADDLDDVAAGGHERIAVHEQVHLDDLDGFIARDRAAEENAHLALDEVVHDQLLAGEGFVKVEDIDDVAVRELEGDRFIGKRRRAGNGGRGAGVCLGLRRRDGSGRLFRSRFRRRGRRGRDDLRERTRRNWRDGGLGLPENGSQRCETQRHEDRVGEARALCKWSGGAGQDYREGAGLGRCRGSAVRSVLAIASLNPYKAERPTPNVQRPQ